MKILGIESSCDETAAAVVEDGRIILSNVVATQIPFHQQFNGVVPEIASRKHAEWILPVVNQALTEANLTLDDRNGSKTLSISLVDENENFEVDLKDGVGQGVRTIISFVLLN